MNRIFLRYVYHYSIVAFITFGLGSCGIFGSAKKNQANLKEAKHEFYPNGNVTDGPYIFKEDSTIVVKWIEPNMLLEVTIFDRNFSLIEKNFGFTLDTSNLFYTNNEGVEYVQDFQNVKNIIAVSDIHGQYFIFEELLKKYHVIDNEYNWSFGTGHLVINGDIFDRGDNVTKILWLVYKLKNQAEQNGGKVHYIIGNHELMILNNDLRYLNKKYVSSEMIMSSSYDQLFSENSIIGAWLRTCPVILTINDILFVHGGISPEFVERELKQANVNEEFRNIIFGVQNDVIKNDTLLSFLKGSNGPIWYRGYFTDNTFTEQKLDRILEYFDKNRIVVGHTTQDSVISLFEGKILGIDSGILYGKDGELLIYEHNKFYRGTLDSGKIELK